jgi:hypothetical protein
MNTDCLTAAAACLPSKVSISRFSVLKKDSAPADSHTAHDAVAQWSE